MRVRWPLAALAAALLFASCGGGDGSEGVTTDDGGFQMDHGMDAMDGSDHAIDFGYPGDPSDSDRTVRIEALDSLEFDPARVEVDEGEVVTFVVTNAGKNTHEFALGDENFQIAHQEDMSMDGMSGDKVNSVELEPGDTKEITWVFTDAGEVLYGCHKPGHYEGGMIGTVSVG